MQRVGDETDDLSTMPSLVHDEDAGTANPGSFVLTVVDGPDRGLSLTIDGARPLRSLIGHSTACELRLSDFRTSRRHVSVNLTRKGLRLTDLASKNGTMIGAVRVIEALLTGGETIHLGDTTIQVERSSGGGEAPLGTARRFGGVIGASPQMRRLFPLCERLAASVLPILLEGEVGTGKERMAEALHEASARASAPFVVFDCTATSGSAMVDLLCAAIVEADGGTLFVDEVGALDALGQARLLRLLDHGEVQPAMAAAVARVDVRVVVSTGRSLNQEVQARRFRDNLFSRLAPGRIELPPLRDRAGDIGVLTRHFWRELGGEDVALPAGLVERFGDYAWPGNVTELIAAVTGVLAAGELEEEECRPASPPAAVVAPSVGIVDAVLASDLSLARGRARVVADFERRYVQRVLDLHHGNVSRAAAASGLARRYFQVLKARHLKGG